MKKIFKILVILVIMFFLFTTCVSWLLEDDETSQDYGNVDYSENESDQQSIIQELINHVPSEDTGTDWVVYWYLCGSDLETDYGSATDDLYEMLEVDLPEGVKVVIQTGGAYIWNNDLIDPNYTERYVYDSEGLKLIEQLPVSNMGDPQTLIDFLKFAETNYPGDRTMLNFWNHGGGSVSGAAFDELFYDDSLTLTEMENALVNVYGYENEYYPIDIVGFDTCLMATLSTAHTFSSHANYLVASQELVPGNGWYYTGIFEAIAQNPTISPVELSIEICDTYVEGCEIEWTEDEITMSVTNLAQMEQLIQEYDDFGLHALDYALDDPSFFTQLSKIANNVENYGGNTREQGYTNMVDMGQLVLNTQDLFPQASQDVIDALNKAVIYKIDSKYRPDGMGLSTYYSYNGDIEDFMLYTEVNPVESINYLYSYALTGNIDNEGMQYLESNLDYSEELPELQTLETVGSEWEDAPLTIDEEGSAVLNLGPEAYDALSSIEFELYYSPVGEDLLMSLGTDNDIVGDWENGIFKDNFRGVWGHINGSICYMELIYEADDYNEYSVPVKLNGEDYNLNVIYDFNVGEYEVLGARKPLSDEGAADKNLVQLKDGDVIETVHYATDMDSDDDFLPITVDTIIVDGEVEFTEEWLPDGYYFLMFVMHGSQGDYIYSDVAMFESIDGEIYTYE